MKTAKTTVLTLLLSAAALVIILADVPLGVSAVALGGLLAIVFADYRQKIKPLRAALASVTPFRAPEELRDAA